ncbi:MAG: hypothetical protein F4Z44_16630 [Gemmatimonadetes bacterium]|nr:hypothetical protein [Gemmatimonadota bacterium]
MPYWIGTCWPDLSPIRREKNGVGPLRGAKLNTPEPSRKKSRRSRKRCGNRVRLTRRSSLSTSAKSVLMLADARRLDVTL